VLSHMITYCSAVTDSNLEFVTIHISVLCSSFRGYPLMGKVIPLPNGYRIIVAQETVKPVTEGAERNIHVMHTFKSFTYWNWDKPPSLNDALISALDWIDVSEAVIDCIAKVYIVYPVVCKVCCYVSIVLPFSASFTNGR